MTSTCYFDHVTCSHRFAYFGKTKSGLPLSHLVDTCVSFTWSATRVVLPYGVWHVNCLSLLFRFDIKKNDPQRKMKDPNYSFCRHYITMLSWNTVLCHVFVWLSTTSIYCIMKKVTAANVRFYQAMGIPNAITLNQWNTHPYCGNIVYGNNGQHRKLSWTCQLTMHSLVLDSFDSLSRCNSGNCADYAKS